MSKIIVVPDSIDILPFHQVLSWEKLQSFCTDVLYKKFKSVDSREYLLKGSNQQGIDVYSLERGGQKITVAQCKLVKYLGPQQVLDIIDEFVKGNLTKDTKEFILCTSADLGRQRDEEKTIKESRRKLLIYGIDLIIWDERGLSKELRTNPSPEIINIVYRYFGEDVALGFYGEVWLQYIKKLRKINKRHYKKTEDYIERNIISYADQIDNKEQNTWNYWSEIEKSSLIELLEKNTRKPSSRIVLLSTAGYGKTEELNNVAGYFSDENKVLYPFKLSLRDYEGQAVDFVLSKYETNWRNIQEENILLLFDGLDEISERHSQAFINHLNAFVEQNPAVQIVVSSRYNFYDVIHPQLREFEIFLLNPLTSQDTVDYMTKKIGDNKEEFEQLLDERNFSEYIENPYYLTRLVRFFNDKEISFPNNKTELFDRILFEQLEKDEGKYNLPELKLRLLPFARQIAFCMVVAGKSAITDDEMKIIIPDHEARNLLKHFSILNRNATSLGSWSFEHKNLQEYLSASEFAIRSFTEIINIISFKYNRDKLLPRFLNTISFLFELISKDSLLFQNLFNWINSNEPELLVRFEKDQLSKYSRFNIFKGIFNNYKKKGITIRVSANFSYEELSRWVEVDESIIDFLAKELEDTIPSDCAYDALSILGHCKRAYIYEQKLKHLMFSILANEKYDNEVKAKAISTFVYLEITEKSIFKSIIQSGADLNNIEIRDSCLYFLNSINYYEDYSKFIFESINILEEGYKKRNSSGSFISSRHLILKFHSPKRIKEIFQYCISDKNCIQRHSSSREFHFEFNEVKLLLEKATEAYKKDHTILAVIYRLYCGMGYISVDQNWFNIFKSFFENTCGTDIIFMKFYKYDRRDRDIMSFASQDSCDFLIQEYKNGSLEDKEMAIFRNVLNYVDHKLFLLFYEKLKTLDNGLFVIEDVFVDYNEIRIKQEEKNQLMLLNQNLFLEEATVIFKIIAKDKITTTDLWYSENIELRKFQSSIVIDTIRNMCINDADKIIAQEEFYGKYSREDEWAGFVIDSVVDLLKNKSTLKIHPDLMTKVKIWCVNKIEVLEFENSIKDIENGYSYIPIVEFVKDVFLLLDLELEDKLLIKILPSDYENFYSSEDISERTISGKVIKQIRDKNLLRDTVLGNIKNEQLASPVLCSHFKICHELHYRECLPFLYKAIIPSSLLSDYNRIILTGYYLDLGGQITDFTLHLKIPDVHTEGELYSSWTWFLIEKLQFVEVNKVTNILLQIINDPNQIINNLKAAELLIQLSRIEGLEYWGKYVRENGQIPFEHKWSHLQQYIIDLPPEKAIEIFCSTLIFCYENDFQKRFSGSHFIEEAIFNSLVTISNKDFKYYGIVKKSLEKMINNFSESSFVNSIKFYSERLTQKFYESQTQEVDIKIANSMFHSISKTIF